MTDKQKSKEQLLSEIQQLKQKLAEFEKSYDQDRSDAEELNNESTLKMVLHNSPFPIAVVDDQDQHILFWSKSAQRLFGHSPNTTDEWYQLAYPDLEYRQQVIERWKPYLEQASTSGAVVNTGAYRICCKDGSIKTCELYAQIIPGHLIVTLHDITTKTETATALAKSQVLLAEAQQLSKLGGFLFDVKTLKQTWTDETFRIMEIDGLGDAPAVPEGVNFIAPEYRSIADTALKNAMEKGEPYDQEWEIVTAKGNRKWARAKGKATYENGEVVSISGSFQDITEQKQAEKELAGYREALEEKVEERTRELEEKNGELNKAMRVFVGREAKIIELQKKIKALQGK